MSKSAAGERGASENEPLSPGLRHPPTDALTLDDETEAETTEGQERKDRLFLGLRRGLVLTAAGELEGQSQLCGLHIFFDLNKKTKA